MTELEQKADNYYFTKYNRTLNIGEEERYKAITDAYITGVTENGIVWHDLRKNPKDLPPLYETVLDDDGEECFYVEVPLKKDVFVGKWKYYDINGDEWEQKPPIAWCEKPKFE